VQSTHESIDVENKWRGSMLMKDFKHYVENNDLLTEEMKKAKSHLYYLNLAVWTSIPV